MTEEEFAEWLDGALRTFNRSTWGQQATEIAHHLYSGGFSVEDQIDWALLRPRTKRSRK